MDKLEPSFCAHGVQRFLLCRQCVEEEYCECDEGECGHCERRRVASIISEELGLTSRASESAERAAHAVLFRTPAKHEAE